MVSKQAYPDMTSFSPTSPLPGVRRSGLLRCRLPLSSARRYRLGDDVRPERARAVEARGDDPDKLPEIYARVTRAALEGKPADMAITMHSCRGNFRSTWIAAGRL